MMLSIDLRVNANQVERVLIQRVTNQDAALNEPDLVSTYDVWSRESPDPSRVEHRYGDGLIPLAIKALQAHHAATKENS